MEIKQLKLNGENIYPKVAIDSIVGEDGSSKVDTIVTENSDNLITSGAVYTAVQQGGVLLNLPLSAINNINANPTEANKILVYDGSSWVYADKPGDSGQIQSDWNLTNTTAVDFIKNKPDLSIYAKSANLSPVAISGSYTDLTGKPNLATVATSGSYNDLSNKPSFIAAVKALKADDGNSLDITGSGTVNVTGEGGIKTKNPAANTFVIYTDGLQEALVSGTNIKTINNQSILGQGNITIEGGGGGGVSLNQPLLDINNIDANPTGSNKILVYDGNSWGYADKPSVTIDDHLDANSTNPVQNKIVNGTISRLSQSLSGKVSYIKVGDTSYNPVEGVVSLPAYPIGNVTKVAYSNNAGEFTPDASGTVTLTIDQTLDEDSGRPVTNAAIKTKFNSVEETMNGAVDKIELVNHAVDSVTQKTVQYTTIGGLTPTTLFDIDYKVKKGSYNPVASQAVYTAIDNAFKDLPTQYSKGIYLTEVLNYISHVETVAGSNIQAAFDMSGQISWFNACGDSGQTDRLVKKQYSFGYVPVTTETTPWHMTVWSNAQVWVDEINNRNNTDFVIDGAPLLELNEVSSGRYEISIDIKLVSAKYQVVSIDNLVFYYNGTQLSQAAPAVQSIDRTYTYSQSRDGIYIDSINNEVVACINSMWYKIADLETSPIKPLS